MEPGDEDLYAAVAWVADNARESEGGKNAAEIMINEIPRVPGDEDVIFRLPVITRIERDTWCLGREYRHMQRQTAVMQFTD